MEYIDEEEREKGYKKIKFIKFCIYGLTVVFLGVLLFFIVRGALPKKEEPSPRKGALSETAPEPKELSDEPDPANEERGGAENQVHEEESVSASQNESAAELLKEEEGTLICEYKEISLPEILSSGDVIDVRLSLGDGRDYTVLTAKKVGRFEKNGEKEAVWLAVTEEELLCAESAKADLKVFQGARLYGVIHNGGDRGGSQVNYPVNKKTEKLIRSYYQKEGIAERKEVVTDKKLNKERKNETTVSKKDVESLEDTASYWSGE